MKKVLIIFYSLLISISSIEFNVDNSKVQKGTLRKLLDNKNKIIVKLKGKVGDQVKYLNFDSYFYNNYRPNYVYLNDNLEINYVNNEFVTLNKNDDNKVDII